MTPRTSLAAPIALIDSPNKIAIWPLGKGRWSPDDGLQGERWREKAPEEEGNGWSNRRRTEGGEQLEERDGRGKGRNVHLLHQIIWYLVQLDLNFISLKYIPHIHCMKILLNVSS